MYKLNEKKRIWILKQHKKGVPVSRLALAQKVHRRTIYKVIDKFDELGLDGLKDHKPGRPEVQLNPAAERIILGHREYGYGACHIEQILKRKGFSISHRQIEKVLIKNGLVKPNPKKQKPRKWVRYELPNPNDMWHTDWSYDPFTGGNITVFIDDRTRYITGFGLFKSQVSKNGILVLNQAILAYGTSKSIMTDHGAQYYANHPNADQKKLLWRKTLDSHGIKHVLARVNRPQTNGKVERFFRTYKEEFAVGKFSNVSEFMQHYNEVRLHMSLRYKTPKEAWDSFIVP